LPSPTKHKVVEVNNVASAVHLVLFHCSHCRGSMSETTITFWPDLHTFMQHPGVVLRHWPLHERSQREHADAAGNGEERDDGGECIHEEKSIEGTLQHWLDLGKGITRLAGTKKRRRSALVDAISIFIKRIFNLNHRRNPGRLKFPH
jgi:hypothetical protein